MKRTLKTAAKNTVAGLAAAGALLSAGGSERPLVTDAERVEAVQHDQEALLHHIGACGITGVKEIKGEDFTDREGNSRVTLKVHLKSEETPEAQKARTREKILQGAAEFPMQFSAYARNPANPSKPSFAAGVLADERLWKPNEAINDDIGVYPIKLGTKMSPGQKKVIDVYAENTVFVAPEYEEQGLVDAKSREYCGTFQGTLNSETGKTEWTSVQSTEQYPDRVFYDQK